VKLHTLTCAAILCAGSLLAVPLDIEGSLAELKTLVEKKDSVEVKKLATEISAQAREEAAEAAPAAAADKEAWQSKVARAKEIDLYTEYALSATALQSEPAVLVDLIATLEHQNPKSKYLDDAYAAYFVALTKSGAAAKVPAVAEKALANFPSNPDILYVLADAAYAGKRFDRAAAFGARLAAAIAKKAKPEGMPAADWDKKKSLTSGYAYRIAGLSYFQQNDYFNAEKNLRPSIPFLKGGDEGTLATVLYCMCVSDYNLGRQGLNKAQMLEGANYCDQAAKLKSPVAQQAWTNAHNIRAEAERKR